MSVAAARQSKTNGNGKAKPELLSIQKIAFRCGLDRATTKKRLDALGYEPAEEKEKLKLYVFDPAMEAELTETNDKYNEVRIRKETANAQLLEQKLAIVSGDVCSVAEFTDYVQRLFGSMHKEIVVRFPKKIAGRVNKAKTTSEASAILTYELKKIFTTLREDREDYLK